MKTQIQKYRFGFDIWGLILFLVIMLPNFLWFAVPAQNDILRKDSATPGIDTAASIFQVLMAVSLIFIIKKERSKSYEKRIFAGVIAAVLIYAAGWACYYQGITNLAVIVVLTLAPCLAFLLFGAARRNIAATVSAGIFTVCHLIHGAVNFVF